MKKIKSFLTRHKGSGRELIVHQMEDESYLVDGRKDPIVNATIKRHYEILKELPIEEEQPKMKGKKRHSEKYGTHKLNENDVHEIKISLSNGSSKLSLANKYGVSPTAIKNIEKGITWKNVV